jgi:YfiH family protein
MAVADNECIKPEILDTSSVVGFFSSSSQNTDDGIARAAGVTGVRIYLPIQKHTNSIQIVESDLNPVVSDAVLTARKNILIGVKVADCVPILLYDINNKVIGAVHAGWRGTSGSILKKTVTTMKDIFRSSAKDIIVAIGPSIRGCCYCVGDDVAEAVFGSSVNGDLCKTRGGRQYIDLSSENVRQALLSGVSQKNIWQSDECTFCNPDRFYSYRYAGGTTGRQGGYIMLK